MDRHIPLPQELYRHLKGNTYQIITIATHSESGGQMVVYQALYGDYKVYVRDLGMFMSEVDHVKYPDAAQKYRFEQVEKAALQKKDINKDVDSNEYVKENEEKIIRPQMEKGKWIKLGTATSSAGANDASREEIRKNFRNEPYKHSEVMDKSVDDEAQELNLDPLVIQFMDADLAVEKNDILSRLRPTITNDMIDIMAMSLGVVVNEGDVYDRYNDLRNCLSAMEKFESTRLRS